MLNENWIKQTQLFGHCMHGLHDKRRRVLSFSRISAIDLNSKANSRHLIILFVCAFKRRRGKKNNQNNLNSSQERGNKRQDKIMEMSLKEMEEVKEHAHQQKLENLFELFPHVNCDEVRDIFEGVAQNIQ